MKKRLWILRTFNVGLFYATLLIGFGSLLPGHWIPGSGVLSILFPFLLFPHLIMILIWARFRPQHMLKNLIALGLLFFPVMAQFPIGTSPAPEQTTWKVASYNVRAFYQQRGIANDIAQWTQTEGVDILCTQEMRRSVANPVAAHYPYRVYAPNNKRIGTAIYSKFPIINHGSLVFDAIEENSYAKRSAGYADIALPNDTIRIINIHLSSTGIKDMDMEIEPTREEWIEKGQFMAKKIARSDRDRGKQGRSILQWVDESPYPVVLTGDFNSVPGGNLYARLLWKLDDPYLFKGSGAWGSYLPLLQKGVPLRIDWTLVDEQLPYSGQYLRDVAFSDHRPLVTTFSARTEPQED